MAETTTTLRAPKPIGEKVLIQILEEETSIGTILLPDTIEGSTKRAKVIEVGEDTDPNRKIISQIPVGSVVIVPQHLNVEIKVNGIKYYIVRADEILAIL